MADRRILVLGVGNILYSDEGIGVRAAEYLLANETFPDNVEVVDGGTLGMRLMDAIMACDALVVLDAVLGNGAPGSLYRLEGDGLRASHSFRDSMHQMDLVDTLVFCELAGHRPTAVVIGMEPADCHTMGTSLTPPCAAKLPDMCRAVMDELARTGASPCAGADASSPEA